MIDLDPISNDEQQSVMEWITGDGPSLHPADDEVDHTNPLRADEQRFYNYKKRRSALRATVDLKRQVFLEKVHTTASGEPTNATRPAPVP